jgi:hypothetical protein
MRTLMELSRFARDVLGLMRGFASIDDVCCTRFRFAGAGFSSGCCCAIVALVPPKSRTVPSQWLLWYVAPLGLVASYFGPRVGEFCTIDWCICRAGLVGSAFIPSNRKLMMKTVLANDGLFPVEKDFIQKYGYSIRITCTVEECNNVTKQNGRSLGDRPGKEGGAAATRGDAL